MARSIDSGVKITIRGKYTPSTPDVCLTAYTVVDGPICEPPCPRYYQAAAPNYAQSVILVCQSAVLEVKVLEGI